MGVHGTTSLFHRYKNNYKSGNSKKNFISKFSGKIVIPVNLRSMILPINNGLNTKQLFSLDRVSAFSVFHSPYPSLLPDMPTFFYSLTFPACQPYAFESLLTLTFADFLGEVGWIMDSDDFSICQD